MPKLDGASIISSQNPPVANSLRPLTDRKRGTWLQSIVRILWVEDQIHPERGARSWSEHQGSPLELNAEIFLRNHPIRADDRTSLVHIPDHDMRPVESRRMVESQRRTPPAFVCREQSHLGLYYWNCRSAHLTCIYAELGY